MKPVKVGLIGLGAHAMRGHVNHATSAGLDIIASADPDSLARQSFQVMCPKAICYDNVLEMMQHSAIEAVIILSPDRFHFEQATLAIDKEMHVLCEKPIVNTIHELEKLSALLGKAKKSDLILTSCHPRRFDPPYLWLKRSLFEMKQKFGNILRVDFDFSYPAPKSHKADLHMSLLMDHLSHEIDMMNFLCGASPLVARKIFDEAASYAVTGVRRDGIAFNFSGTRFLEKPVYKEFLTIRFVKGGLRLDTTSGKAYIEDHESNSMETVDCPGTDHGLRMFGVNANFSRSIRGLEKPYLTGEDIAFNNWIPVELFHHSGFMPPGTP